LNNEWPEKGLIISRGVHRELRELNEKTLRRCVLLKGSFKRSMGKPLRRKNTRAYFDPERLPSCPDENSIGTPATQGF
jgi:hypothetical protein